MILDLFHLFVHLALIIEFTIMKNRTLFASVFFALIAILIACSEDTTTPNTISEFNVTGMVCQHGCGGSIRKGLYEKEMATQVDVEFDEETGLGNIAVYHNNRGISSDKIKELIETLNDGQFEVEYVGSKEYSAEATTKNQNKRNSSNKEVTVEAREGLITFPNITDLLNSLIK